MIDDVLKVIGMATLCVIFIGLDIEKSVRIARLEQEVEDLQGKINGKTAKKSQRTEDP